MDPSYRVGRPLSLGGLLLRNQPSTPPTGGTRKTRARPPPREVDPEHESRLQVRASKDRRAAPGANPREARVYNPYSLKNLIRMILSCSQVKLPSESSC
jgi:hypothetical protein